MSDEGHENLLVDVDRWTDEDGPIIRVEGVTKSFGELEVLKGVDLEVMPGEITVIVGASGSGKTVLMKCINGLIKPDEGHVYVFGKDVTQMSDAELDEEVRKRVATMFQNYALFDSMTVAENVSFPLVQNNVMSVSEARELAAEHLGELGLGDVLDEYPSALSGGMKKRVALARTIVTNPELVLFDDPTTGLDPILTQFVDEMLLEISRDFELTSLVVSHNMASIFRLADRIAILHDGKIIATGTPDEMRGNDDERVQQFVGRIARQDIQAVTDQADVDEDDALVTIRGLHKSFGDRHILKGVDLTVPRRKITVLIGGSGAGKSVMMKHILGLMKGDEGAVKLFGKNVAELDDRELAKLRARIGMLFQHSALFDSMNVRENVAFPLIERRECSRSEARERTDRVLEQLKIADIADRLPSDISNGQQKRVSLARAIISEPELMVYDEPTTGQDPIMSDYVEKMILEAQDTFELTSIVISHDMASTFRIADRVALLHKGEIIAEGDPYDILHSTDERVREFVFASQADPSLSDSEAPAG
jgi:ABC-type transporter Mla maintaining outer membrane lipid asymmetry ATPase subunit MlaF